MPSFPYKLHNLLETVTTDDELSAIISWLPDGKSFKIHSQEQFEKRLLKEYFPRQTQVKSFMRQLQYYNFENFGDGLFCHNCFKRGQRNLCGQILHQLPTKSQKAIGKSTRPLKPRGRKKKSQSRSLGTSPVSSTTTHFVVVPSSPEPSLPDEASSVTSSVISATDHEQPEQRLEMESPTCVKDIASHVVKNDIKDNAPHAEELFKPPSVVPQHQPLHLAPQFLAQYEMQAVNAARSTYFSCLQQELLLGSILYSKRRLSMEAQRVQSRPMPWSSSSA